MGINWGHIQHRLLLAAMTPAPAVPTPHARPRLLRAGSCPAAQQRLQAIPGSTLARRPGSSQPCPASSSSAARGAAQRHAAGGRRRAPAAAASAPGAAAASTPPPPPPYSQLSVPVYSLATVGADGGSPTMNLMVRLPVAIAVP